MGPHDTKEELKLSTQWKVWPVSILVDLLTHCPQTKRESHASRVWDEYEKRRYRLLDYAERLEQRAGSKFRPTHDGGATHCYECQILIVIQMTHRTKFTTYTIPCRKTLRRRRKFYHPSAMKTLAGWPDISGRNLSKNGMFFPRKLSKNWRYPISIGRALGGTDAIVSQFVPHATSRLSV